MITYNLEIVSLEVYPHTGSYDNVVYNVFSRYWADENGLKDITPINISLEMPQDNFIPYDQLTYEVVSGWVTASVDMNQIQVELSASLAQKALPPTSEILPVPW